MNCQKDCLDPVSSKCVEYSITESVFDKLVSIENDLKKIYSFFDNSVDGKTLGTGSNLLFAIQKLIDKSVTITPITKTNNIKVDLSPIGLPGVSTITQEQLNKILIDQIEILKNQLGSITLNNNY